MAERVALVLGGGGLKGLAHVGAWRAIRETGVEVTEVIGTSIGSLVGANVAGGMDYERLAALARTLQKTDIVLLNRWALLFNGIRQQSVFRGDNFRGFLETVLPAPTFGELDLPLSINAVDLETGDEVWFGAGGEDVPLADAVYASCALPVFYPPALIEGRYYVDGGVVNGLPIERALQGGADRVIAIDVGASGPVDVADTVAKGMVALHQRAMQIAGNVRRREVLAALPGQPNVTYVRPELAGYSTFDFNSTEYFLAEGYRATLAALTGEETEPPREAAS